MVEQFRSGCLRKKGTVSSTPAHDELFVQQFPSLDSSVTRHVVSTRLAFRRSRVSRLAKESSHLTELRTCRRNSGRRRLVFRNSCKSFEEPCDRREIKIAQSISCVRPKPVIPEVSQLRVGEVHAHKIRFSLFIRPRVRVLHEKAGRPTLPAHHFRRSGNPGALFAIEFAGNC